MFCAELVNLNTLLPQRHLGFALLLGSGIEKTPFTYPFASVTILPPNEPPSGVTYALISTLSKKA